MATVPHDLLLWTHLVIMPCPGHPVPTMLSPSNHPLLYTYRTVSLIVMILYTLVGLEIFKRRQAFKTIGNDEIPLGNHTPRSFHDVPFDYRSHTDSPPASRWAKPYSSGESVCISKRS